FLSFGLRLSRSDIRRSDTIARVADISEGYLNILSGVGWFEDFEPVARRPEGLGFVPLSRGIIRACVGLRTYGDCLGAHRPGSRGAQVIQGAFDRRTINA